MHINIDMLDDVKNKAEFYTKLRYYIFANVVVGDGFVIYDDKKFRDLAELRYFIDRKLKQRSSSLEAVKYSKMLYRIDNKFRDDDERYPSRCDSNRIYFDSLEPVPETIKLLPNKYEWECITTIRDAVRIDSFPGGLYVYIDQLYKLDDGKFVSADDSQFVQQFFNGRNR